MHHRCDENQSGDGRQIETAEPAQTPDARAHASHPASGVLPRNVRYAKAEYASTTGVTITAPIRRKTWLRVADAAAQSVRRRARCPEQRRQQRHGSSDDAMSPFVANAADKRRDQRIVCKRPIGNGKSCVVRSDKRARSKQASGKHRHQYGEAVQSLVVAGCAHSISAEEVYVLAVRNIAGKVAGELDALPPTPS